MLFYLALIDTPEAKNKFEELYISYEKTMFYVANKFLKDKHLSEDAVHQAFYALSTTCIKQKKLTVTKRKDLWLL